MWCCIGVFEVLFVCVCLFTGECFLFVIRCIVLYGGVCVLLCCARVWFV